MKLTKSKLKEIIKEELENTKEPEAWEPAPLDRFDRAPEMDIIKKPIWKLMDHLQKRGWDWQKMVKVIQDEVPNIAEEWVPPGEERYGGSGLSYVDRREDRGPLKNK